MRLTVQSFVQQSARVRSVLEYIDEHLDEDITLKQLADVANLSSSQLQRLYFSKVQETPVATLRRLRLQRARRQLREGRATLIDIALAAGYGSHAAFTRAFVRQFGHPPSALPTPAQTRAPNLRLEWLPAREVYQVPYHGSAQQRRSAAGHLSGSLAVGGARRWRHWTILDRDHPLIHTETTRIAICNFVSTAGQPHGVRGVDRVTHPAGLFAVHEALDSQQPRHLCALIERIRAELGCLHAEGPFGGRLLLRDIKVSSYTAPQERRTALCIPVVPCEPRRRD